MGYRKESTLYRLKFEKYDGLTVDVKSMSVGDLMDLSSSATSVESLEDIKASVDQSNKLLEVFAKHLVRWNLEDEDGKTVPASLEGIRSQEMPFVLDIIINWMNQIVKVNENLGQKQNTMPNLGSLTTETLNHPGK
jgi:hypothetical protein